MHGGDSMEMLTRFFKAASDPTRLRILALLGTQDFCVCELTDILGLSQPKVSKHLAKLRDLGFVSTRRDARFVRYYLSLENEPIKAVHDALLAYRDTHPQLKMDAMKIPSCLVK